MRPSDCGIVLKNHPIRMDVVAFDHDQQDVSMDQILAECIVAVAYVVVVDYIQFVM